MELQRQCVIGGMKGEQMEHFPKEKSAEGGFD